MNQQIFDQLIGEPPRSTVDVDDIVARQRRRQRLQQVAAGGSAAVAVVLAVALGVSLTGNTRAAPQPAASPVPSPSASASGLVLRTGTEAGRRETLGRLRTALEQSTTTYAPGARWIYMPDVPGEKRTPDGHPTMWVTTEPVGFEGRSGIVAGGRKGGFYLSVRPIGMQADSSMSPLRECDGTVPVCAATRTPQGLDLVHWVDKPDKKYVFYGTQVTLRGGAWALTLRAVNYFGGDASPVSAPVPALTRDQLDAIATGIAEQIAG